MQSLGYARTKLREETGRVLLSLLAPSFAADHPQQQQQEQQQQHEVWRQEIDSASFASNKQIPVNTNSTLQGLWVS